MPTSEARTALAIAAALAAAGCRFSAGYDGTRYQCDDSFRCPDGQLCVGGYCEDTMESTDAAGGGDGGAGSIEPCGDGQVVVRDEFDTLDEDVWTTFANGDANVFASSGDLVVSSTVDSDAGIIASDPQDLDGLMVSVEVGERSSGGNGSLASLQLMDSEGGDTVLVIERLHDDLRAVAYPLGAQEVLETIDFDADEHRFLRIITIDDTASFEYSSDEEEWTDLAVRSITDLPPQIRPQLQSGSYGDVGQDQAFDLLTVCRLP